MKLANIGATVRKNRVQIDLDDVLVNHAVREVGTYVCDVLFQMGIRNYDPSVAQAIARQMLEILDDDEAHWANYMRGTAPKINSELKSILSMNTES
jgi:hypothetical protein